jgi:PAS domain S-box-containing protein
MKTAHNGKLSNPGEPDELKRRLLELESLRQQSQASQKRFDRFSSLLRLIGETQHLLFHETDQGRIIRDFCRLLVEKGYYSHAWIVLLDNMGAPTRSTQAGFNEPVAALLETMQKGIWPHCLQNAHDRYAVLTILDPAFICGPCSLSAVCQRQGQLIVNIGYSHSNFGMLVTALPRTLLAHEEEKSCLRLLADSLGAAFFRLDSEPKAENSLEKYRQMIEAGSDWIWETDIEGRYTYVSPQTQALLGYAPYEMVGRAAYEFMDPGEAKRVGAIFRELTPKKTPFRLLQATQLHRDGSKRVFEISGTPIFNEQGEKIGSRGTARDITEHQQVESALHDTCAGPRRPPATIHDGHLLRSKAATRYDS